MCHENNTRVARVIQYTDILNKAMASDITVISDLLSID